MWQFRRNFTETSVDNVGTNCGSVDYYRNGSRSDRTLLDVHSSDRSLAAKNALEAFEGTCITDPAFLADDRIADRSQFGADPRDQPRAVGKNRGWGKAYHSDRMGSSRLLGHCEPDGYHRLANGECRCEG